MKKLWHFITEFKKATGNLIFLAIIIFIIFALISRESMDVPDSAVMIIDPEGYIVEQKRPIDVVEQLLADDNMPDAETLGRDLIEAIDMAAADDRIKAIALDLSDLSGSSLAQYDAIGKALDAFKAEGKPVYAFGARYTQSQYYLASFADRIYIDKDSLPFLGGVLLRGIGAYPLYLKSALDKLQITLNVIKAGDYKDAVETVLRDDMSEFSRQARQELVDALWAGYLKTIGNHRDLSGAAIVNYINNYDTLLVGAASDPAQLALSQGLIDGLVSKSEWRQEMKVLSGKSGDSYKRIGYRQYLAAMRPPVPVRDPTNDAIAVIVAKGTILDGEQPSGEVGGDSLARLIRKARNDASVKAIVLRVDSPGGSAAASELIRSELAFTQAEGKPVVASMGGYAASGGYWISSTANKIFAADTTVTGSIGAFAIFPTFERTLASLGIHSDGVGTTDLSGAFNSATAMNPIMQRTLQTSVDHLYRRFLQLTAEGRGLTVGAVDAVAQGRVWSGGRALEHGLIDAIGDIDDAIESAAILADVTDYDVIYMEKQPSPQEQLLRQLLQASASLLPSVGWHSVIPPELQTLAEIVRNPGIYLQCLDCRIVF